MPIDELLWLMRQGRTYLDMQTQAHPEGELRANQTNAQFQDWSKYYCS